MRKIVLSMHISLDGFVAGPKGEMDWILVDEPLFDHVGQLTNQADTALYGRVTYNMMEQYWPTAAEKPDASKHDKEHSEWYNRVNKVVISRTMCGKVIPKTRIIGENLVRQIKELKQEPGKNILIFGSPGASYSLMLNDLIDEYWLFVNPVILGNGIPLFMNIEKQTQLRLIESQAFDSGVAGLHYEII